MMIIIMIIVYNKPTLVSNNKKSVTSLWIKWYDHLKCPVRKDLTAHQSLVTHTFPVMHQLRTMHYQHQNNALSTPKNVNGIRGRLVRKGNSPLKNFEKN